ncbi:SusC/RagA family TonB-linked outer membrane protein [Flavobacterium sp.]|uniref:SusC/RagA family TonB-linked outer membrane protein n=1 Tax=Flavobacterium sp. TaxID=239 RepID=UPI0037528F55
MKLKLTLIIVLTSLFSITTTYSQKINVSGVVSDNKGMPIPNANITYLKTAVVSNVDGTYRISVPADAKLVFSYIGFSTVEEFVKNRTVINVSLNEIDNKLEEVVINTGYGLQKKSVVTGSISSVKAKDLEKVPNGRIEQAIQGRVSGVTVASNSGQPGSGSTIRIRGISTFGGASEPLWVVDGFVVDSNGIGYINQSDIESIEVLKDATSAAIYGTRGAKGVILVTTKKGKKGKINVTYNGFTGVSAPAKKLDLLNATEYATLMNEKSVAGGGNLVYSNPSSLGQGTDWQKAIFNNSAARYSHELSFSGANDISSFYVSFGVQDQEGIVATDISHFNKKNIRINSTHKLSKYFTFGQTLGYAHQSNSGIGDNNREFGGPLSSAINLDPTTPLIVTNPAVYGNAPYSNNPVIRDEYGNPYGISSVVGQEMTNPLAYIKTRLGNYGYSDDIVGNAFLEANPYKDLKFKTTFGGKLAYYGGQGFTPKYYLNATNQTSQNSFGKSSNNVFDWNIENTVTYSKNIKNHNFTILLGQAVYVEGIGGGSAVTITNLPISDYHDASFNFDIPAANRTSSVYTSTQHKLSSLFTRVNYDYNEKYLFTGILRRDGSSKFGRNNKYGIFPSFSLGWVASKEDFWKENKYVNQLKIRGGYGIVGNDGIRDFGYAATINGGNNYSFGSSGTIISGYAPSSIENPDLRWEETSQLNIGLETKLFNDFNLTFDYFKKSTKGILRPIRIPGYVGVANAPVGNVADMDNSGLEFELGYRKKIGNVNFSINGNFATLKNEVTNIGLDNFIAGDASFQVMKEVTRTEVGQAYNSFYGYQTAGIFQNNAEINAYTNSSGGLIQPNAKPGDFRWVDNNGDGTIDDNDKTYLGTSIPKYTYGLTLNADYKGFDIMIFTQGAGGNKIFQGLRRLDIGNANYQTVALSRWTGEGSSDSFPRLTTNDTNGNFTKMSDFYLQKGDYLRLKLVQIGYSLPKSVSKKINADRIRLYVTGENLMTFTKYTGYDPEIGGGVFGVDKGFYPQARTFMFGANLQF